MSAKVSMIARIRPKSAKTSELRGVLKTMVAPTRREQGCITYNLHEQVIGTEVTFTFYEVWSSQEDLDRHMRTEHVHRLTDHLDELVDGNIGIDHLTLLEG